MDLLMKVLEQKGNFLRVPIFDFSWAPNFLQCRTFIQVKNSPEKNCQICQNKNIFRLEWSEWKQVKHNWTRALVVTRSFKKEKAAVLEVGCLQCLWVKVFKNWKSKIVKDSL